MLPDAHTVRGVSNLGQGGQGAGMAVKAFLDPAILVCHVSLENQGLRSHCLFDPLNLGMTRFIVKVKALFVSV